MRTIHPVDEKTILESVAKNNRCLFVTEEPVNNSFAQALAGRISSLCFEHLDAPVHVVGAQELPAIPLNATLEATMIPNTEKVREAIHGLLNY